MNTLIGPTPFEVIAEVNVLKNEKWKNRVQSTNFGQKCYFFFLE